MIIFLKTAVNNTTKNREISGKIYASTLYKKREDTIEREERIILPLYDEIKIIKTKRKKIQILVSGAYKKGIFNNEKSILYRYAKKFFDTHHFSFGIEIFITKNISGEIGETGFSEEIEYQKFLKTALENFSYSEIPSPQHIFTEPKPTQNISIHLFPQYKISKNFLQQVINYRNISGEDFILESFYEVRKKFSILEKKQKNLEISEFGLIGDTPNFWVKTL